jgi:hypothetical protein
MCQPRVIVKMIVEKQMECRLAGETEVLGENLAQRHFCPSQNPTWPDPGLNPGRRGGKPATNRLSYGAAFPINLLLNSVFTIIIYSLKHCHSKQINNKQINKTYEMNKEKNISPKARIYKCIIWMTFKSIFRLLMESARLVRVCVWRTFPWRPSAASALYSVSAVSFGYVIISPNWMNFPIQYIYRFISNRSRRAVRQAHAATSRTYQYCAVVYTAGISPSSL